MSLINKQFDMDKNIRFNECDVSQIVSLERNVHVVSLLYFSEKAKFWFSFIDFFSSSDCAWNDFFLLHVFHSQDLNLACYRWFIIVDKTILLRLERWCRQIYHFIGDVHLCYIFFSLAFTSSTITAPHFPSLLYFPHLHLLRC